MIRTLLLAAVVVVAPAAAAQSALVLTETPDGVTSARPTSTPVGNAPAALVLRTDGGWHLVSLSPGDVPAEVAERRVPAAPALRRTRTDLGQARAALATFERAFGGHSERVEVRVRGGVTGDIASVLSRLADAPALRDLSADTDALGQAQVEATFEFDTMENWSAWTASPDAQAVLDLLTDRTSTFRAHPTDR